VYEMLTLLVMTFLIYMSARVRVRECAIDSVK
jgi:hypothetical protein